jgi:hypothetical protein
MSRRAAIFLLCSVIPLFAAASLLQDPGLYDYLGDMGGQTIIGLTLQQRDGEKVVGSYFYKRYLKDIPLSGEFTGDRDLVLREKDSHGQPAGTFTLHFADKDPRKARGGKTHLTVDVLTGTWKSSDDAKTLPVYLALSTILPGASKGSRYQVAGVSDDAIAERNAQAFCAAVAKDDRKGVASFIVYPLALSVNGKRSRVATPEEFLSSYDRIFTPRFVERIRAAIPHNMFANAQGIMIADGAVWFDDKGKVKAVNN